MRKPVRAAVIGCGNMGRHHIRNILKQTDTTEIAALCDPLPMAIEETAKLFARAGQALPPDEPDLQRLLADYDVDAAFIVTPHALHHDQAKACLEAGVDVLLEKPMAMNATEARSLMKVRDETGKLLVVAFNGSLSPEIRESVPAISASCSVSAPRSGRAGGRGPQASGARSPRSPAVGS